jgi:hypothetical protein
MRSQHSRIAACPGRLRDPQSLYLEAAEYIRAQVKSDRFLLNGLHRTDRWDCLHCIAQPRRMSSRSTSEWTLARRQMAGTNVLGGGHCFNSLLSASATRTRSSSVICA